MFLRQRAAYNGLYRDFTVPGAIILRRAERYLERGTLVAPGWSTRQFDLEVAAGGSPIHRISAEPNLPRDSVSV